MISKRRLAALLLVLALLTATATHCFASNWFVIAASSTERTEALKVLKQLRDFGCRGAFVGDSSEWPNLTPGFWITVAGDFTVKSEATDLASMLKAAGIPAYIREPGKQGDRPKAEANGEPGNGDVPALFKKAQGAVVTITADDMAGTGFAVASDLICTCYHVVKGAKDISVSLPGTKVVEVVVTDSLKDVAILRIDRPVLTWLKLNKVKVPPTGTRIYTIGTPLGFYDKTMSDGIVSGLRKEPAVARVQITAPISPGCSGGPIMTIDGVVIGMAEGSIEEGQALNMAVSAWDILAVMARAPKR
jgi:S1-C subfamily serine protease